MRRRPPIRVAMFATHPIQYQTPWFCRLASCPDLDLKVFFGMVPDDEQQGVGFDIPFQWDIPLLEGYPWVELENAAASPKLGGFAGCNTPGIRDALLRWPPQIAILTGWHSLMMFQAIWACRRLRIPIVVRGEANSLRSRPWIKRAALRALMKAFDRYLAIGKANGEFYVQAGVQPERIFDCPYFVDNERFSESAARLHSKRTALREMWRIADGACCFLFAGKMVPKKRPLDLIRAIEKARRRGAFVHLLVVGAGDLLEEAKALARKENFPVTFAGFLNQSEIAQAYVAADCLVLPSDAGETWGLVVNEAMACGIPAIVSDRVGCGPDLVQEGETGSTFPYGDITALADKLQEFSCDIDRLKEMGQRARQRVFELYSVDNAVDGTLAAIKAAAERQ